MRTTSERGRDRARGALVALLALVGASIASTAHVAAALPGCTTTWTGSDGSWDAAASWSGGTVPSPADHVCITAPGDHVVELGGTGDAVTVASLTIGATSGTGTQTLVMSRSHTDEDGSSLVATGGIDITARGELQLDDPDDGPATVTVGPSATIVNAGRLVQTPGQDTFHHLQGDVVNTGTFGLHENVYVEGSLTSEGILDVGATLTVEGTVWTKAGTVAGGSRVVAQDGLRIGDAAIGPADDPTSFWVEGGTLSFEADHAVDVAVFNDVRVVGDTAPGQDITLRSDRDNDTTLSFSGTWTTRGDITMWVEDIAHLTVYGTGDGATLVNHGTLRRDSEEGVSSRVHADLRNHGDIDAGVGYLSVTGDLASWGRIDVGPGGVVVGGALELAPTSEVDVEVVPGTFGGYAAGLLDVGGTAAVDGTLGVESPVVPPTGTSMPVIVADSRTGTFDDVTFVGDASYDVAYSPTGADLVRRASETATRRFVRAAYQDFLGRQPTASQLDQRATAIDAGTLSRAALVRELARSDEYTTALVQRFYADTLGRPGDPDGLAYWVDQLRTGAKTVAQVAGSFYASDEYFQRAGATDEAWITNLYGTFFDRAPSGTDLPYWTGRIASRGRTRVATELFQSLESRRQRVDRLYQDLLGRDAEPGGRDYWADRLTREGDLVLASSLAASSEYLTLAQPRYP